MLKMLEMLRYDETIFFLFISIHVVPATSLFRVIENSALF